MDLLLKSKHFCNFNTSVHLILLSDKWSHKTQTLDEIRHGQNLISSFFNHFHWKGGLDLQGFFITEQMINDDCSFCPPGQRVHLQVHYPVSPALLIGHRRPERGGVPSLHPRALHVHPLLPLAGKQRHQSRGTNTGVCMCVCDMHLHV